MYFAKSIADLEQHTYYSNYEHHLE